MLLEMLNVSDDGDLARLLGAVARAEREFAVVLDGAFGSIMASEVLHRSIAASVRLAGIEVVSTEVGPILAGDSANIDPIAAAAVRGVADALHAVLDRPDELPLSESQLKYLQSLLLRHEPAAAAFRRQYRREGADAESIPADVARLVAWTKSNLELAAESPERLPPMLVIAAFAWRLVDIRPFAVGTGRLARVVVAQLMVRYGYHFGFVESVDEALETRSSGFASAREARDSIGWVAVFLDAVATCAATVARSSARKAPAIAQSTDSGSLTDVSVPVLPSPRQTRVLTAMHEFGAAKIGDLLPVLGIPRATLKKDLRTLVEGRRLSSTGVRKGTVYRVLPEAPAAD